MSYRDIDASPWVDECVVLIFFEKTCQIWFLCVCSSVWNQTPFLWQLFWFEVSSFTADLQVTTKKCFMEFKQEWKPSDFRGSESKFARYIWSFLPVWFTCFIGFDSGTNHTHILTMTLLQHLQITDKRTCWHGNAGGRLNADPQNVVSTQPAFSFMSSKCCADI